MIALGVSLKIELLSLLIHVGLFLLVLTVFSRWLLRPLETLLQARADATTARTRNAAELMTAAQLAAVEYRAQIDTVRTETREMRDGLRREGFARATTILEAARSEAMGKLEAARAELHTEGEAAKKVLVGDAKAFGKLIGERIIERDLHHLVDEGHGSDSDAATARKANQS
jgi:F0F1-type ATP synthase membrane subunit b/b'